jgi:hypothetical protein
MLPGVAARKKASVSTSGGGEPQPAAQSRREAQGMLGQSYRILGSFIAKSSQCARTIVQSWSARVAERVLVSTFTLDDADDDVLQWVRIYLHPGRKHP